MKKKTVIWRPHDKQRLALSYDVYEILFGGSRGGGKSECGRAWLVEDEVITHPQYRALVIRKNSEDLGDWVDKARNMYLPLGAVFVGKPVEIRFPSGAIIKTGHLKDENAFEKYIGHEYHRMLIEELTLIPFEKDYTKLLASCRSTIPELRPHVFLSTNPGNDGHSWVKKRFIDVCPPEKIYTDPITERTRVFVPATLYDNPTLMINDPGYLKSLEGIPDENTRKAWIYGDWNVFAGQFFTEWRPEKHIVEPFKLPDTWKRYRSIDFGRTAPFVCLWFAIDYDRNVWVYREYFSHRPDLNELGKDADVNAKAVVKMSKDDPIIEGRQYEYSVLDAASFAEAGHGEKISNLMARVTKNKLVCIPSAKERIAGWTVMHSYLRWDDKPDKEPQIKFFNTCVNSIRTIPELGHDKNRVEDVNTNGDDHCLSGDTKVDTLFGKRKIKNLVGKEVYVNSTDGFVKCRSVRKVGKKKVYKLTLSNGKTIKATEDHKFLTTNGWKELKDLDIRYACLIQLDICIKQYLKLSRSLMANAITSVVSIFRNKVKDYILRFGDTTTEKFQMGFISTTGTITEPITTYQTSRNLADTNIYPYTTQHQKQNKGQENILLSMLNQKQLNGTSQKQVGSGTVNTELKFMGKENILQRFVNNVVESIKQDIVEYQNTAIKIVKLQPDGEEMVYDLTVPSCENFTVNGGMVVHNCGDAIRYLLQTLRGRKTIEPLSGTAKLVASLHRQKSFPEGLNNFYNND